MIDAVELDLSDNVDDLEDSLLALNFADDDPSTIDIIIVPNLGAADGLTFTDIVSSVRPALQNVSFIEATAVPPTPGRDTSHVPGHEVGHIFLDGFDEVHSMVPTNLMFGSNLFDSTVQAPKRLTDTQHRDSRRLSGPTTIPPLLRKIAVENQ